MPASRSSAEHFFFATACLLAACALVSGGCGRTRYPSSTVQGKVTIDGVAVPKGHITFSPIGETKGPTIADKITNGEYRCEKVPQGRVQVTFIAQAAEPTLVFDKVNNVNHEVPKDILPPACRQGQPADIGPGVNHLDFDLKSE